MSRSRWKVDTGIVKASLWPTQCPEETIWIPLDEEEEEIAELPGVVEISSDCCQPYKIIVEADTLIELQGVIDRTRRSVLAIINKYNRLRAFRKRNQRRDNQGRFAA